MQDFLFKNIILFILFYKRSCDNIRFLILLNVITFCYTLFNLISLFLSNYPFSGSDVEEETDTTFKLFHGQKINWLTGHKSDGIVELYVCDESSVVTKYTVR